MTNRPGPIGLYYHIPFCARLCHYCDFVKTALHDDTLQVNYLRALEIRTREWLRALEWEGLEFSQVSTVFFGGGTPSLLDRAYLPLFEAFRSFLKSDAEVTLEANPEHIKPEKLRIWSDLGVNRLSLGIQSFQSQGLRFLTREHSPREAAEAVSVARSFFSSLNVDLIYGWQGQSEEDWLDDLEQAIQLGATHLSLYSLTYEGRTPFARRVERGRLEPSEDSRLETFYRLACERLADAGMVHEEVSNWAYPSVLARHNALYWHGDSYIGLGAGAHSHLAFLGDWGTRWKQNDSWKAFSRISTRQDLKSLSDLSEMSEYEKEMDRGVEAWILETVSSGLRTLRGINLDAICARTGYILQPRPALAAGLESGLLILSSSGQLILSEAEWFRETRWALEVCLSLSPR